VNRKPIRHLRWWIAGLLFTSTIINYIDRQTLSVLAPFLKEEYQWTNTDFATVLIAFRIAYTIGQGVCGRLLTGCEPAAACAHRYLYSVVASASPALAQGCGFSVCFRFLLGAGESANGPARQSDFGMVSATEACLGGGHVSTAVLSSAGPLRRSSSFGCITLW
jgi:ACS family hexuronate transporter-like MFS transporter